MSDAPQTAKTPTDARQASMSRVVTHETLMQRLTSPPQAAQVPEPKAETPPATEPKQEKTEPKEQPEAKDDKPQGEKPEVKEAEAPRKKSPQERIHELADKRREAEAKAEAAERRAQELEAEMRALKATAKPLEVDDRPVRAKFATDDEYVEALTDWKAQQAIAKREQEQAQARIEAEEAEIAAQWNRRQEAVMKAFPDYADVVGKSEVAVPNHIVRALYESEMGPQIAYYLALNQDEAKRLAMLKPIHGIKRIAALERELADLEREQDEPAAKPDAKPQAKPEVKDERPKVPRSKAPEPIEPPRSVPSTTPAAGSSYAEYKARRQAQLREKRAA